MELCLTITALILVVVVIGVIAFAVRSPAGSGRPPPGSRPSRPGYSDCPKCDAPLFPNDRDCPNCGLDLLSKLARQLDRVRIARREIRQLEHDGQLDHETADRVAEQLDRRRHVLLHPARPAIPPPLPSHRQPEAPPVSAGIPPEEPRPPATPPVVPTPPPLPVPRRSLAEVFGQFMHERNILWGELAGGLLIVGCSIALVVSLWRTLEELPYFTFLLIAGITAAVFGAGYYTLHHWKLKSTSRGLLVIALLLTPLNLLLLADPGSKGATIGAIDVAVKVAGVLAFAGLVRTGARDLVGTDVLPGIVPRRWLLALAVVGAPASQILPAIAESGPPAHAPLWLPLTCFVLACGPTIHRLSRHKANADALEERVAIAVLVFVGLGLFALFSAWGFALSRTGDLAATLRSLALPTVVAGVPVLSAGLLVQRRLVDPPGLRATGTGVVCAGMIVPFGSLVLAWPDPILLLASVAAVAVVLGWLAYRDRMPWMYAGAIPCAALAAVLAYHGLVDGWMIPEGVQASRWLGERIAAAPSGAVLAGFALVLGALSEGLIRRDRLDDSRSLAIGAAGIAAAALALVTAHGIERPTLAGTTHVACAVGFLAASLRWRFRVVAQFGVWLILLGSLWTLWAIVPNEMPTWSLVVACESLALALIAVGLRATLLRLACRDVASSAAVLAPILALFSSQFPRGPEMSGSLFAVAATAIVLAGLYRQFVLTWIGSLVAVVGLTHLLMFPLDLSPGRRAVLLALLIHATLATAGAIVLRRPEHKPPDVQESSPDAGSIGPVTPLRAPAIYIDPFRFSARLTSCLGVLFLLMPPPGMAAGWAGLAVWTAVLWLAPAITWRERGIFPAFQAVLTWAAALAAFAWVEVQDWYSASRFGPLDPRALHAYGLAVGLLGIAWGLTRRVLRPYSIVRDLWADVRPSMDQVVLAALVVGQLLLAAGGVIPAVVEELTPLGTTPPFVPAAETSHFWGVGAWLVLVVLTFAVGIALRWPLGESDSADVPLAGLTVLALTVPVLVAGQFAAELAAASALRWTLAIAFVTGTGLVAFRESLGKLAAQSGFRSLLSRSGPFWLYALLAAAAAIVLLLTAQVAMLGFAGEVPSGPIAQSVFRQIGWTTSVMIPLALIVVGLSTTALRERLPGYAYVAGWVWIATLAGGYALGVVTSGESLVPASQMRVAILACGAAATWSLAWLAIERRVPANGLLAAHIVIGFAGIAFLCVIPLALLMIAPARPLGPASERLGWDGWLALVPAAIAAYWHSGKVAPIGRLHTVGLTALLGGVLLACAVKRWDQPGKWLSLHVLAAAWASAGLGMAAALLKRRDASPPLAHRLWPEVLAIGLTMLGVRGAWSDPLRPLVPAGMLLIAGVLFGAVAVRARSRLHEYMSGALAMLAGVLLWISWGPDTGSSLALTAAVALASAGAVWAGVGRAGRVRDRSRLPTGEIAETPVADAPGSPETFPPFAHTAAIVALGLLLIGLIPTLNGATIDSPYLAWGAVAAVGLALGVLLWDRHARFAVGGLYVLGVAATTLMIAHLRAGPIWLDWPTPVALAVYVAAASTLAFASRFGLRRESGEAYDWFVLAQGIVAAIVLAMSLRTAVREPDLLVRLTAPLAATLLFAAAAMIVRISPVQWASLLRPVALLLAAATLSVFAWAITDPAGPVPWLTRHSGLFVALTAATVGCLSIRPALSDSSGSAWIADFRRVGSLLGIVALGVLVMVLIQQIPLFDPATRKTPLDSITIGAVIVAILALMVLALRLALRPNLDPLGPTPFGRTGYVYLAEVLLVLLFAHVRLNIPQVFRPEAVRLWTFIVMLLAFVGVGLAELFARRGLRVLSRPLLRTGVLLPLIPLVAFWAKPPVLIMEFADARAPGLRPMLGYLERLPQHFDTYALLWFLAGLLYGLIALSRRSFGWALIGALATNFGLWALLTHHQVPAAIHPQAWAIPLALIVLVSEHVNRHRLRAEVASGLRYLGITMIYVSSASDLFIAGVGNSLWLPVILAALCLAGVAAGVLLRVRAFLYLGIGFLLLDIFSMIWHAAVDRQQTWIWYASGIILGAIIIALFAVLEKRRNDVRELVGRLRDWD
jgi:hypothetical protein